MVSWTYPFLSLLLQLTCALLAPRRSTLSEPSTSCLHGNTKLSKQLTSLTWNSWVSSLRTVSHQRGRVKTHNLQGDQLWWYALLISSRRSKLGYCCCCCCYCCCCCCLYSAILKNYYPVLHILLPLSPPPPPPSPLLSHPSHLNIILKLLHRPHARNTINCPVGP